MTKHLFWKSDRARRPAGTRSRRATVRGFRSLEQLEDRSLLTAIGGVTPGGLPIFDSWRNPISPLDVNGDERVTALDALVVINALNESGPRQLPGTPGFGIPVGGGAGGVGTTPLPGQRASYIDVNGDGKLSPLDALNVINKLNAAAGEQVRIRLVATDVAGNPITSVPVDTDFQIRAFVQDIRANAQGVFGTYTDITYNSSVASVAGAIAFDPFYDSGRRHRG